ncbi:MAG: hypothetical protein AB7I04_18510 [Pseudomonadales bacterium]
MAGERWIPKELDEAELWKTPQGYVVVAIRNGKVLGASGRLIEPTNFMDVPDLDYWSGSFAAEIDEARAKGLPGWVLRHTYTIHEVMYAREMQHDRWLKKTVLPLLLTGGIVGALWLWA